MKYVSKEGSGKYIEKNSEFISLCFSVLSLSDFNTKFSKIKEIYKDATHYPFALRILNENGILYEKFSDSKEPYGTAGIPMLELLKANFIINSAIVTVRYFGGTKLGKSNLLRAYLNVANSALKNALFEELREKVEFKIELPYSYYERIKHIIEEKKIDILNRKFGELVVIDFKVPKDCKNSIISELKNNIPIIKIQEK